MHADVVPFKLYPETAARFRRFCKTRKLTADQGLKILMSKEGKGGC